MRLLIDIGNTRLKWTVLDGDLPGPQQALAYSKAEITAQLTQLWSALPAVQAVYVVSVAEYQLTDAVIGWIEKRWHCPVEVLQTGTHCAGVINGYAEPESLGTDRWAAMVAAYRLMNSAVCVFDCGTALTCDAIDHRGRHLGGAIVPGKELMYRSLLDNTARIERLEVSQNMTIWGTDTASCVEAGRLHATIGFIESAVQHLQQQLGKPVTAVLTGGDAESLLPWLSVNYRYEANLVLQGIARIVTEQAR